MKFSIINRLEIISEITTEWTTICPVCNGKIKVRKDNGAYLCVGKGCKPEKIRKELGLKVRNVNFLPQRLIDPLPLNDRQFSHVYQEVEPPDIKDNETFYIYNPYFLIKRVDLSKSKKVFYPYFNVNNQWKQSKYVASEDKLLLSGFYRSNLVEKNDIVIIAEGEKCTDFIINTFHLKCITPCGFGWSENWLKYHLPLLNLGGIIIIPDHDPTGIQKAFLLQRVAWTLRIPCSIKFLYPYLNEDKDIADISQDEVNHIKSRIYDESTP